MFWLWRQHRAGHEMPHGAILHAWGAPAANYDDLKELGLFLKNSSDFLTNNLVSPARMAIVYSHEADAGLRIEEYANNLRYYDDWTYRFYLPFHDHYLHRDVISPTSDLSPYNVVFMPLLPIIPDATRARLQEWVRQGGTLILGPMSGYRTELWASYTEHAMGDIAEWSGIDVTSRIPIGTQRRPKEIPLMLGYDESLGYENNEAGLWSEALVSPDGKVLARYQNGMHEGEAAIVENTVGQGKVVVLGTDPGRDVVGKLWKKYAQEKDIKPILQGEPGVLVVPRGEKGEGLVLVNINNATKSINLPGQGWQDIHSEEQMRGSISLKPYEVRILRSE